MRRSISSYALTALTLISPALIVTASSSAQTPPGAVPRDAERFFRDQRAYPFGRIPQEARGRAIERARELEASSLAGTAGSSGAPAAWRPIGPYNVGGRVNSIAVHPTDGRTVWIGAADGGVWKSTDRGASWRPVMDGANSIALGAVAVDPVNPLVLYAGTGEAAVNIDSYTGAGVYKSTDGGETWTISGLTHVAAFSRILVHPSRPEIVLAAAIRNNGGIYRSADAGRTWTRISERPAYDITVNPVDPDEMWVGGGVNGAMHSIDAGATFAPVGLGIAVDGFAGRVSLQVAPSDPRVLWALVSEYTFNAQALTRIYRSDDRGATWSLVMDNEYDILNFYGYRQGEYNNVILVNPLDANDVIAGGVVMIRTLDGGVSWQPVGQQIHVDHHALAYDPTDPQRIYFGNDGGMYRSDDGAATFERISRGLAITQFYGMGVDQRASAVTYGGTQDNGTIATTAEEYMPGGPGILSGSDGFHVAIDHDNSSIVYLEHPYGEVFRVDLSTGSQLRVTSGLPMNEQAAWAAPLVMDPNDAKTLYTGRQRVFRFNARTSTWRAISQPFRSNVSAIGVSPLDSALIYAGSDRGEMRVTSDGGATWSEIYFGNGLPDRAITDIAPSTVDRCAALVSYSGFYSGHVYRTTDCGVTWRDISTALSDIPANAIAVDPMDEGTIAVGTDIGVFVTSDTGASWSRMGTGMPIVAIADLAIHHPTRTLRAATHGRSMFEIDLGNQDVSAAVVSPAGGERWVGTSSRSIVWNAVPEPVRLEYSLDGMSWREIAASAGGGAYRWTVPDSASTVARIRATSIADPSASATSSTFTIEKLRPGLVIATSQKPIVCMGLAYDGDALWAASGWGDTLAKLDSRTLATIDFVRVSGLAARERITDIAFHAGRGTLFLHTTSDYSATEPGAGALYEVDRAGTVLNRYDSPCILPFGLAVVDDPVRGSVLLASDVFGDQSLYVTSPETGETLERIARDRVIDLGPAGMTTGETPGVFWQVIADFSFEQGPRGSTAVRMSLASLNPTCVFSLATSDDSSAVLGQWNWGRLFAQGIERDPRDGSMWVTNVDGAIYKFTGCDGFTSSARAEHAASSGHAGLTLVRATPNPAHDITTIELELTGRSRLDASIVDARGRVITRVDLGDHEAGSRSVPVDLTELASGVYSIVVSDGVERVACRIVRMR